MTSPPPGCAVVMAHPDDEVLWASSVLATAGRVILCFGDSPGRPAFSEGRRRAVGALPLSGVESLEVVEASAFDQATWPIPEETPEGLALRKMPFNLHGAGLAAYRANFETLCRALEERLKGLTDVVTHNPWGEYGHEDHVQVFRAVEAVQQKLGFRIWVTCYVSDKAVILMQRHLYRLGQPSPPLGTDKALGDQLRRIYTENGCWTWPQAYVWPDQEWFYPLLPNSIEAPPVTPCQVQPVRMNMIRFDFRPLGRTAGFLKSGLRHVKYRLVRRFPIFGRVLEAIRNE